MNYKKIIGSRNLRLRILGLLNWIPSSLMVRIQYWIYTGRLLNMKSPLRFTEKMQWYKLNCHMPAMLKCTDKYEVRKFVSQQGYEDLLIPLIGVFDTVEEIDFESLPTKFVAKTTDGAGGNQILKCENKDELGKENFINQIKFWLHFPKPKKQAGREWAYENGFPRRIIVEELLMDGQHKDLIDYKFWCFQGLPRYCQVIGNRSEEETIDFFDMNWCHQSFRGLNKSCNNAETCPKIPKSFAYMKKVAAHLSKGFPFVRVDFYDINGRAYFGELTFYPAGGYGRFTPDEYDFRLGEMLKFQ